MLTDREHLKKGFIDPGWIFAFFASLGLAVYIFSIPESWTLAAIITVFFLISALNTANGVSFLLLALPFFLGATASPYFWTLEVFVYGLIAISIVKVAISRTKPEFPLVALVVAIVVSAFFSVPLDAKEYFYELWLSNFGDQFQMWLRDDLAPPVHYFRVTLDTLSAAALFYVTCNSYPADGKTITRLATAITIMCAAVSLAGIAMLYDMIPKKPDTWHYLSLSLVGRHHDRISAFAFNRQYFAQYLLLCLPLAIGVIYLKREEKLQIAFYILSLATLFFCFVNGGQRSSFIVTFISLFIFIAAYFWLSEKKVAPLHFFAAIAGIATLMVMGIAAHIALKGDVFNKFSLEGLSSDPRYALWHVAMDMFKTSPLLGIGSGRFNALFFDYYKGDNGSIRHFVGETHSLYFQKLSEQGALGLLIWALFVAAILYGVVVTIKKEKASRHGIMVLAFGVSFINWLALGFFNNMFYIRSQQFYFWIVAGLLCAMCHDEITKVAPGKTIFKAIVIVLAGALGLQLYIVYNKPISLRHENGFYRWERQPDNSPARWMKKRAYMTVKNEGAKAVLTASVPFPDIAQHPQTLRIFVDGQEIDETFTSPGWRGIEIPLENDGRGYKVLRLETGYVFNPKKSGIGKDDRDLGVMLKQIEYGK